MQAGTSFPKVRRMLLFHAPLILIHFWPASTLLRGHLALATLSLPETDPQILERWGCAWDELCSNTCENITAHVCFCRSEFTGLTATRMTRGPESEWPRVLRVTVAEWAAILDTSAVTIISLAAAKDIRKHLSHRIVPSRHVYRENPGEGVEAASKA